MGKTFITNQKELASLLASMQPICSKRTTLDITESILFQITPRELTLKATDLEISLRCSMQLEQNTIENESFLVSGKRIHELVKELDGEIEFTLTKSQLVLKTASTNLALNIRDAADFPPFPERIENLMEVDSSLLLTLLGKVAFLIPNNHSNAALNGMLLEFGSKSMAMTVTDGHCLVRVESEKYTVPEDKKWLLPKRAILEMRKVLEGSNVKEVFLGTCGNQLVFSGANFNFFTKILSETFPEYKPVMNKKGFHCATVARDEILKALKRANCFLAGQFISTNLSFSPGKLDISLQNKEVGKLDESIVMKNFDGENVQSKFYSPYLLNGLSVFPDKDVSFFVKTTEKPIIFESQQDDYHFTYLVMPVSATQQR
jgi:DNA polymerase-3 subunit beta